MPQIYCFTSTFKFFFMNVIKSNFDCMHEQENYVLKSMKLKVVVLKIFRFWFKNGLSCKEIDLYKVKFY